MDTLSETLDVLVIGTGFSGIYLLFQLRRRGYRVKAVDANSRLGGVWRRNVYPGARVDIEVPKYELGLEQLLYQDDPWIWTERFPSGEELQRYFDWIDDKLDLSRNVEFETWIDQAIWDDKEQLWQIRAKNGRSWKAKFFLPCLGYAAKPYIPDIKGLDDFSGRIVHSAEWPQDGITLDGKKVGVIGTGASGVQVIQEIAENVKHLTVFQRTPALAIPMQQKPFVPWKASKAEKVKFYRDRQTQWDGSSGSMIPRSAQDDTPEQRESEFQRLWNQGGFAFWTSNYMDMFTVKESNDIVYQWWRDQIRDRVHNSKKFILAPDKAPYAFGTKRVPLEQKYYETFNLDHVSLIDLNADEIKEIQDNGILMQSGALHQLDILIMATGFDISTGSFSNIDIRGRNGIKLSDKWSSQTKTYLGVSVNKFPNMFFSYGPQSPSNVCNGPVCAQVQGKWIVDLIEKLKHMKKTVVEAKQADEDEYSEFVSGMLKGSLFEHTDSFLFANKIHKSKKDGCVFWMAGVPAYIEKLADVAAKDYKGLQIS